MEISDLTPRTLEVLHAVLLHRNVAEAARELKVSPSQVSQTLAHLRSQFNDALLVPVEDGMDATPRARAIQPVLTRVLNDLRQLARAQEAFEPAATRMDISLAATDYAGSVLLPELIRRLSVLAPQVRVSVRPLRASQLPDQFERDGLDLALMPRGNTSGHLRSSVLYNEEFVCAARRGHAKLAQGLDLDAYCELTHVLVSPSLHDFSGQVDGVLEEMGRERKVRISVPSFFSAVEVVRLGDDLVTLPARLAQRFGTDLELFTPPIDLPGFAMAMIWHERDHESPANQWLRGLIRDVANSGAAA